MYYTGIIICHVCYFYKLHLTQVRKWHLGTGIFIRHCVINVLQLCETIFWCTPASITIKNINNDYWLLLNVSINREIKAKYENHLFFFWDYFSTYIKRSIRLLKFQDMELNWKFNVFNNIYFIHVLFKIIFRSVETLRYEIIFLDFELMTHFLIQINCCKKISYKKF